MVPVQAAATGGGAMPQPQQPQGSANAGGGDQQILYNVEYIFDEDGKQVRKVPIEMNGQTIWVECVEEGSAGGGAGGGGGVFKGPDSIIMDLNGEGDGES